MLGHAPVVVEDDSGGRLERIPQLFGHVACEGERSAQSQFIESAQNVIAVRGQRLVLQQHHRWRQRLVTLQ